MAAKGRESRFAHSRLWQAKFPLRAHIDSFVRCTNVSFAFGYPEVLLFTAEGWRIVGRLISEKMWAEAELSAHVNHYSPAKSRPPCGLSMTIFQLPSVCLRRIDTESPDCAMFWPSGVFPVILHRLWAGLNCMFVKLNSCCKSNTTSKLEYHSGTRT